MSIISEQSKEVLDPWNYLDNVLPIHKFVIIRLFVFPRSGRNKVQKHVFNYGGVVPFGLVIMVSYFIYLFAMDPCACVFNKLNELTIYLATA